MTLKPALTIKEQIDLLISRGLSITDRQEAEDFLVKNNYYRLNIYFHKYMIVKDTFKIGVTFNDVKATYYFDRWFRNRLLYLLEPIETNIKSRLAYHLALKYGSGCFYKNIFKNQELLNKVAKDFNKERERNSNEPVIYHHEHIYGSRYPIWVIVEFLSFNSISNLYSSLYEPDKKEIAIALYKIKDHQMGSWLHSLSILRNICAHYGYLYKRSFDVPVKLYKVKDWDPSNNRHLFALCLVLKRMTEQNSWEKFIQSLKRKQNPDNPFSLLDYGFPVNWEDYL